jgi:hypothetical protein
LLKNAATRELDWLCEVLNEPECNEALGVLEMIAKNPDDLLFYEAVK